MKTEFHRKLEALVRIQRKGEQHWTLIGASTVRLPPGGGQEIVPTKRALYAAFIGPIEQGSEVLPDCGHKHCIKPDHQRLFKKLGSLARALSLPEELAALQDQRRGYALVRDPYKLPAGMTLKKINLVKRLWGNNTLAEIVSATGLDRTDVMKVVNGVYDEAAKNSRGATKVNRAAKAIIKAHGKKAAPPVYVVPPLSAAVGDAEPKIASSDAILRMMQAKEGAMPVEFQDVSAKEEAAIDGEMTEDERNWLRMNTKGCHGNSSV